MLLHYHGKITLEKNVPTDAQQNRLQFGKDIINNKMAFFSKFLVLIRPMNLNNIKI